MPEQASFNPIEPNTSTDRPQKILDRYIKDIPTLNKLISPQKISNSVVAEAAQEIDVLNTEDIDQLTVGIFDIIGTEKPIGEADPAEQDYREGALELLRLINFKKANKNHLLENYLSQLNQTPGDAEPYGSIYTLLEAGAIIAPHLPDKRLSANVLIDAWERIIATAMNRSIVNRNTLFNDLRGKLNAIITALPFVPAQMPAQEPAAPKVVEESKPANPVIEKPQRKAPAPKLHKEKPDEEEEDIPLKIFERVSKGVRNYEITPEILPWLKEKMIVSLNHNVLKQDGNPGVYIGMCIAKGDPADVAEAMGENYRRKAFNTFATALPGWVTEHSSDKIKTLTNQRTLGKIHYTSNPGGQRLYFMEIDRIGGEPVIIIIGMCDKAQQIPLLRAFTTTPIKDIKRLGKL